MLLTASSFEHITVQKELVPGLPHDVIYCALLVGVNIYEPWHNIAAEEALRLAHEVVGNGVVVDMTTDRINRRYCLVFSDLPSPARQEVIFAAMRGITCLERYRISPDRYTEVYIRFQALLTSGHDVRIV